MRLPSAWPDGLPIPSGATPVADESDGQAMRIRFETSAASDLIDFFRNQLPIKGWRIVGAIDDPGGGDATIEIENETFWGEIDIEPSPANGDPESFWVQLVR